jgi:hypothetical protein
MFPVVARDRSQARSPGASKASSRPCTTEREEKTSEIGEGSRPRPRKRQGKPLCWSSRPSPRRTNPTRHTPSQRYPLPSPRPPSSSTSSATLPNPSHPTLPHRPRRRRGGGVPTPAAEAAGISTGHGAGARLREALASGGGGLPATYLLAA